MFFWPRARSAAMRTGRGLQNQHRVGYTAGERGHAPGDIHPYVPVVPREQRAEDLPPPYPFVLARRPGADR
ncbi:hypothetical protein ACWD6K_08410 [Streptomyces sp. NPDC002431]